MAQFKVGRWMFADVAQNPRVKIYRRVPGSGAKVHCRGSRVKVPKIKVNGWRLSDVDRGQIVEVQMSESVVSVAQDPRVRIYQRISESECERSEVLG